MHDLVNVTTHANKATLSQWCRVLGVSRSGLYAARKKLRCPQSVCALSVQAKAAFETSGQSYGSRRLSAALQLQVLAVGRQRARTLMRSNGLRARWRRKFVHTPTAVTHCQWRLMCWRASSILRLRIVLELVTSPTYARTAVGCTWPWCWTCSRAGLLAGPWRRACLPSWCAQRLAWPLQAASHCRVY